MPSHRAALRCLRLHRAALTAAPTRTGVALGYFLEFEGEYTGICEDPDEWENEGSEDEWAHLSVEQESALIAVERDPLYRGCLVVDIGWFCSVSSFRVADLFQLDLLQEEGSFWHDVTASDKKF